MIVKSARRRSNIPVDRVLPDKNGLFFPFKKKYHIRYSGVLLEDKMNWQYYITSVCSPVAQSTGIFYKLRSFRTPTQLRQNYHTPIYPHIFYAIVAWGSAYKSHINKLQVKQNTLARVVFFPSIGWWEHTISTAPTKSSTPSNFI